MRKNLECFVLSLDIVCSVEATLGLSFPLALGADPTSPPSYGWLRLNPVWPQNSGAWARIAAGEAQRVWLESGTPGLLAFLLAGLHQRYLPMQRRQALPLPVCRRHEM